MKVNLKLLLLLTAIKFGSSNRIKRSNTSEIGISDSDCELHLTCTDCVASQCHWCVEANLCTHDTAEQCTKNDIIVNGSATTGQTFCPAIHPYGDGNVILVPTGDSKSIKVKVNINIQYIIQARFACQFIHTDGRVKSVSARLLGDTIYCDPMKFEYPSNSTIPFAVAWGGSKSLDNPDNIQVLVYGCNDMCDSCATCLALPEKYNCGWCETKMTCEVVNQCSAGEWINRSFLHRCTG